MEKAARTNRQTRRSIGFVSWLAIEAIWIGIWQLEPLNSLLYRERALPSISSHYSFTPSLPHYMFLPETHTWICTERLERRCTYGLDVRASIPCIKLLTLRRRHHNSRKSLSPPTCRHQLTLSSTKFNPSQHFN